jgi:fatty-acyl-CoA synthase
MYVPLLVDDFLRRPARLFPDKIAIIDDGREYTYRDYQARVNQLSNALLEQGVSEGDRVCILSPNSHFFLESFYATSQIGAVLVPLNYRLMPEDHEYIINHAGVSTLLVDYEYTGMVDSIRAQLTNVKRWIVAAHDGIERDGWTDWERLIAPASTEAPKAIERDENDIVSINYTSGTTARPKGVMLTHRNCYINAYSFMAHLNVAHEDVELWTLPMFHCNGWGGVYALTGQGGTHVVLRAVEGKTIYHLIERYGVTFACMAPAVLRTILDYPDKHHHQIRTQPRFTVAGAPPPAAFIDRLESELGWRFVQIYGLTETAPFLTSSQPDHGTAESDYGRRARAGIPGIGVDIKLMDDDGNEVPRDGTSIGEICARSNVVFKGYWEQPEETSKAIYDGYFHTGDLAVWDEHFNIHIVDRKKDVIISGGENISSPEIEDALYKHPSVLECAVIGIPHEKWGETPKALIVTRPGANIDEAEVIAFCRDNMAHFKCPTSVQFVDALPRTATGKLQKFRLREQFWDDGARKVSG